MRSLRRDESGAMLVLIALLLPVLLGMVGLAMDAAHLYMNRRRMQGIADLSAMAAAQKLVLGKSDARKAARDIAAANGFSHGADNNVVQVNTPFEDDEELIQVELRDSVPTLFVRILGIQGARLRVSAVAHARPNMPVIWAQSTSCSTSKSDLPFYWGGSSGVWSIPMHSNGSMVLGGSTNTFTREITYGCTLDANSKNVYEIPPEQVSPRPWPVLVDPSKWKCDFYSAKDFHLADAGPWWEDYDAGLLKPGVYCSDQKLTLKKSGITGRITLYSKGDMEVGGKGHRLEAFVDNVLFYSTSPTSSALVVSGSLGRMGGNMVAPNGLLSFTGSDNIFVDGSMYAHRITISGSDWQMIGPAAGRTRLIQ